MALLKHQIRLNTIGRCMKACKLQIHTTTGKAANLHVTPSDALMDDKVKVTVRGLDSHQEVTLHASTSDRVSVYGAVGHYRADSQGTVDTAVSHCHGGTFTGVEPMGLFWSMQTLNNEVPGRMLQQSRLKPYQVTLSLHPGTVGLAQLAQDLDDQSAVAKCDVTRRYMEPGVTRREVDEGGVVGTLFLPPGEGPFPTVIDLFGFANFIEARSALLASRGFASFALAHTFYKDLPHKEKKLDFNYFLKSFDWLVSQPFVQPGGVGGVGLCSGAAYLSLIAAFREQLRCLVLLGSSWFAPGKTQDVEGETVRSMTLLTKPRVPLDSKFLVMRNFKLPYDDITLSEGYRNGAKILSIHGEDDQCCHPDQAAYFESQIPAQFQQNVTRVVYPGAGHLIDPPYAPVRNFDEIGPFGKHMMWGGEPKAHADAQEDAWRRTLTFLNTHLNTQR